MGAAGRDVPGLLCRVVGGLVFCLPGEAQDAGKRGEVGAVAEHERHIDVVSVDPGPIGLNPTSQTSASWFGRTGISLGAISSFFKPVGQNMALRS